MTMLEPQLPPEHRKTYRILQPRATHKRPASCEEVGCEHYINGWASPIDEATDLGQRQARYIRTQSGRGFREHRDEAGLTVFTFDAGQRCFAAHEVPVGRPPLFLVQDGDWRGNPRGTSARVHTRAEDWIDDFATHQQTLADRLAQG